MFEEPIKIGLIRFADLYDHRKVSNKVPEVGAEAEVDTSNNNAGGRDKEDKSGAKKRKTQIETETDLAIERRQLQAQQDFDSSHQPILVIYTSLSQGEN